MISSGTADEVLLSPEAISELINDLRDRLSPERLASEVGAEELRRLESAVEAPRLEDGWKLLRIAYQHGFFDLPPQHGIPPISFDIKSPFDLLAQPVGFDGEVPAVALKMRPTEIAGFRVDYPLGLPASVLASNAKWIEFYARRGFDILTYKTVRSVYRQVHSWPNWVFLRDPYQVSPLSQRPQIGEQNYFPETLAKVSMANSFGIPSLGPAWWKDDIRRARTYVREGHQVLIVSVVATRNETKEALAEDFVQTALAAKDAGADIIEANFSCPNIMNDPAGELYKDPIISPFVSEALRGALGKTPLFIKIGYLPPEELQRFVLKNARHIDGVVGINAVSTPIVQPDGRPTFPGGRDSAGVSGWAIQNCAHEVAKELASMRQVIYQEYRKHLTFLSIGGVITKQDFSDRLETGVDAVESCTGAFLNPYLGLEIREAEPAQSALRDFLSSTLQSDEFRGALKNFR